MKNIEEVYPEHTKEYNETGSFYGPGEYTPMLESYGYQIVIKVDDSDYQGDSRLLYKDGTRYGLLIFGWGSCSGCDALQGCSSIDDLRELQKRLHDDIKWFASAKEALRYFQAHDWVGDYSWHADETREFVSKGTEYLRKEAMREEAP